MKKLFVSIIITFYFFSTFSSVSAKEGLFEENLDLPYGVENFEIELPKVGYFYFKDKNNSISLKNFRAMDQSLREIFMVNYRDGKYGYNAINGIVDNYTLFVYHTNKYFEYLSIKEKNPKFKEANTAILRNYGLSRSYLKKVKYIINLENEKN